MQNLPEKRKCQECDANIYGRSDKKFCSEHCRNNFYNRLNRDVNKAVRNINNILRKNRRILAELNPHGKCKIHRDSLIFRGFNFNYFTNTYQTKTRIYIFCYDQGYCYLENDSLLVVKQISGITDFMMIPTLNSTQ